MLTSCPKCEFVFDHSLTEGKCPRCGSAAELPVEQATPRTVVREVPEGPAEGRMRLSVDLPAQRDVSGDMPGAGSEAPSGDEDTRVEHLPGPFATAPLRTRFLAAFYDNVQFGLFVVLPSVVAELILRLWSESLARPDTFQEELARVSQVNQAAGWLALVIAVYAFVMFYYLQIHVPMNYGRTNGQRRYGLSIEKRDGVFSFGVFFLRAIGASFPSTFWIYVFVKIFRPKNPHNDQILGLDDIFSGTRQIADGRVDGSPVKGILTVFLLACIVLVGSIVTVELMKANIQRSRQEERARREALQAKVTSAQGFEDASNYAQWVRVAKSATCTDEPCVSSYEMYKSAYLSPLAELGYQADEIMLHYSRPFGRGGGIRHADEATRQIVKLLVLNGVCYRKQLLADKLITQETVEILERAMYRGYFISMKRFDTLCPMRDPDCLEQR
ncbi:MAG: RDD family protein [Syntrophorhabdus sp. PtaB.Bin047]|nr:MAG: RDD family protein [Syntrophorhabdus sp. PtaB.Bin047]